MHTLILNTNEGYSLRSALVVAIEKYQNNAKEFRSLIEDTSNNAPTSYGALAEQFEMLARCYWQAENVRNLLKIFDESSDGDDI